MIKNIAIALCALSIPLLGSSISGEYGVTGFDPHSREPYQGRAVIRETGDVSDITWQMKPKGPVYQGTGIRKGDMISVVFKNVSNPSVIGVLQYKVEDDGTLAGKWIHLGRNKKGSETLRPIPVH